MSKASPAARAPFLRHLTLDYGEGVVPEGFPFSIPAFSGGIDLHLTRPVTILVGDNGSGKSTLMEAVAWSCGFNLAGGNRNHTPMGGSAPKPALMEKLRLGWLPKIGSGFFFRAESFFNFASYIDELEKERPGLLEKSYGGKSLHDQSHGEAFLALFHNRFGSPGIYILDEPEAALSPKRQLALLRVMHDMEATGKVQFIIATHSPILLTYPTADLYLFSSAGIQPTKLEDLEHYTLVRSFLESPERFYRHLFAE